MIRLVVYVVLGAIVGGVAGVITPVALFFLFTVISPGDDLGVGTVFSLLMIFTVPGGVIAGIAIGVIASKFVGKKLNRVSRSDP